MDCEATCPASSADVRHDLGCPGTSSGCDGCKRTDMRCQAGTYLDASLRLPYTTGSSCHAHLDVMACLSSLAGGTFEGPLADGAGGGSTTCAAAKAPVAAADSRYRYLDMLACLPSCLYNWMSMLIWLAKHHCRPK
jgi:hypothetical protein